MSKIEQIISEIEDYISSCRPQPFSNSKIIVNKEEMDELLTELRLRIPEEVKQYQKVISNQDAIIEEAKNQAEKTVRDAKSESDSLIAQATAQTQEMVEQHEIMQKAYAEAQQVLNDAQAQAQEIIDDAVNQANQMKQSSVRYTDDMLASLQSIIRHSLDDSAARFDALRNSLQSSYDIVASNRDELAGSIVTPEEDVPADNGPEMH